MKKSKDNQPDAFSEAYHAAVVERARLEGYRLALDDQRRRMREDLAPMFEALIMGLCRR